MPRCTTSAWSSPLGAVQGEPQILAASVAAGDPGVQQPRGQVGRAGLVAADGAGVVHSHGGDGLAHYVGLQSAPHHLDLG